MSIVSSGQITITDLSDGMQLNAFITASGVTTQTYDATAQTWSPSYATTPQVLTLNLTKAGSTSSVIGGVSGKITWTRTDGTTTNIITSITSTETQYMSGTTNSVLTTKVNVPIANSASRFTASGLWVDPNTGLNVPFSAVLDLTVVQLAKSAVLANVYTGNGGAFYNSKPASLTVNADLYKGGTLSQGNKEIFFGYADSTVTTTGSTGYNSNLGLGWHLCTSSTTGQTPNVTAGTNTTSQGILTVIPTAVVNAQTFKAVIIDQAGGTAGTAVSGIVTLLDYTDPLTCTIESTAGSIFKNGSGTTTLTCRVFQSGAEIDTSGKTYTYKWSQRDQYGLLNANFGGLGEQYKIGKAISVNANEVNIKAQYICEVNK
ncbi:hypothetical protein [Lactococcus lactis]|uniref:Ig-like domain-containing protein n=2 Tax=Lactococcus lactis TaxID=1358 RepID=A0AAF0VZF8_LACLL|nr:hypothetical protein [Lactococcus lactis]ARD95873.2 hypothetical protein LL229_0988 [Lactococcus lactis subsp. lactis]ARD96580.1 hypothetical protein LL229_1699 [Lactococcus lactis subsp. lactis]ARE09189.1 hypothetical protein LLUC77_2076 [Lactococcus lactis subsp. lactis]MRK41462.1 hypothetical protein [Lactococcus lactis subsp. lactis]WKF45899.1 hypothetical protein LLUC77_03015 [Lactococcus lactis subsp. lactis]